MAIKSSGQLSITEIVAEFPDTAPHSMNEFYRGGGKVPSNNTNIPASGAISFSNFYGATNRVTLLRFVPTQENLVISPALFAPNYVAGITDVTVFINEGVYIWSNSTSLPAITITADWNPNDKVTIINRGFIMGKGGDGAFAAASAPFPHGTAGLPGGPALNILFGDQTTRYQGSGQISKVFIDNSFPNAYIAGGGGGGAGGYFGAYSGGGGGAGGGAGGGTDGGRVGGTGGAIGVGGTAGQGTNNGQYNAGGGGGRILPGVGGQASMTVTESMSRGGGAGGSGAWSQDQFNNAIGSGGGGGWGSQGGFPMIQQGPNGVQNANFLPSYGSGGSGRGVGGTMNLAKPSIFWNEKDGGVGGASIKLNGYSVDVLQSQGRPGGPLDGFYGAIID